LSLARARACLKVVRETGATLMLGFHRRFDPHFAVLRAEIERGTIGDVEMVTLISREPGPPPSDGPARPGGIFRDMTLHDFDMARVLLGEEVAEVSAMASVLGDPATASAGDYDAVQVMLKTVSGKQAMISNSRRASYGHDRRIEVLGSKGAVAARTPRPVAIELATAAGFSRPAPQDVGMTRDAEAYAAEIAAFIAAVSSQAAVSPSGADGLAALALAEAAARSAAEGRAVQLSELAG
jgi:myo-inositol 2-dehydrogenase/D-chiro-inositol 1-dehydrogenase